MTETNGQDPLRADASASAEGAAGELTSSQAEEDRTVEAAPEKLYFISMITKDIELLPSISDLVDNSVDGARSIRPDGKFTGLYVNLQIDADTFSITDNCGGIAINTARHYAFRFGRPKGFRGVESSVGQFGVGMKRALFKLGDHFMVTSTAPSSWFQLTVDVPTWAADENPKWTFEFDDFNETETHPIEDCGTTITVTSLHPEIREDLAQASVLGELAGQFSLQHQSAIVGGLAISINGKALKPNIPALLSSDSIKPINYTIRISVPENGKVGGEVEARIVAGIAAAQKREDRKNEADPDNFPEPPEAGWYVFCNDRLVLRADRTEQTGWGRVMASYHPQYRRFRGYVYLSAKSSELLPWNTTKTGLDLDSSVYRTVREEMYKALLAVAAILNRQKTEVAQEEEQGTGPVTEALESATDVRVSQLDESNTYTAPPPPPRKPTTRPPNPQVSIQYSVDRTLLRRVLSYTKLTSAAQVGKTTFNYFVRHEMSDDNE
jgi:hypothetical protein